MNDKISVIVTVRNEADTIQSMLASLLQQKRRADEIIIVDGQSTDGTLSILEDHQKKGHIKLISKECNIAQGRNIGIEKASHELIAVTDAGCKVDPAWLAEIANCFKQSDTDIVSGNYRFHTQTLFEEAVIWATDTPNRENSEAATYQPSSRSIAFRKSAWKFAKGYPEWLYAAEDTLFNIRLRQLGFKFVFCRAAIVRWRPRQSWRALMKQYFNYARGNGRIGFSRSGYLANLYYHGIFLLLVFSGFWQPEAWLLAPLVLLRHVQKHLWQQADWAARASNQNRMRGLVILVMEWVRLAGMAGFIVGSFERMTNPCFIQNQARWMNSKPDPSS